jgi:hypothetical protein
MFEQVDPSAANRMFKEVQRQPVVSHRHGPGYSDGYEHPTDTATVCLARIYDLQNERSTSSEVGPNEIFSIDPVPPHPWSAWVHWTNRQVVVVVDLNAPREQILEDFRRWLESVDACRELDVKQMVKVPRRRYTPAMFEKWIDCKCVQYHDLQLFAQLQKKAIRPELVVDVLELDPKRLKEVPDVLRKTIAARNALFNKITFHALLRQGLAEHLAASSLRQSPPKP